MLLYTIRSFHQVFFYVWHPKDNGRIIVEKTRINIHTHIQMYVCIYHDRERHIKDTDIHMIEEGQEI